MTKEEQKDRFGRVFRLRGLDELVQEDVEAFNRVYVQLKPVGLAEQRSAQLKAAIVAGWIESPETAAEKRVDLNGRERMVYVFDGVEVGRMKPREVTHYGRLCEDVFYESTRVPDEDAKN